MLLDYGRSWLREYRGEAAASVPGSGGAATLPELFLFIGFPRYKQDRLCRQLQQYKLPRNP